MPGAGLGGPPALRVEALIRQRRKIEAIKVYREAMGVSLKDAKEAVEAMERQM